MRNRKAIVLILLWEIVAGCSAHSLKPKDYIAFVQSPENGLNRQTEINGWEYTLQYKPENLILLNENKSADVNRIKELSGTMHFAFQFKHKNSEVQPLKINVGSLGEYNRRLSYFLNEAQKDFSIQYNGQVLFPIGYLFETQYGLVPHETINLIFSLPNQEKEITQPFEFRYIDRVFGNGIIKFSFSAETFQHLPKLNS